MTSLAAITLSQILCILSTTDCTLTVILTSFLPEVLQVDSACRVLSSDFLVKFIPHQAKSTNYAEQDLR